MQKVLSFHRIRRLARGRKVTVNGVKRLLSPITGETNLSISKIPDHVDERSFFFGSDESNFQGEQPLSFRWSAHFLSVCATCNDLIPVRELRSIDPYTNHHLGNQFVFGTDRDFTRSCDLHKFGGKTNETYNNIRMKRK